MKRVATTALVGAVGLAAGAYLIDLSLQHLRNLSCPSLERLKAANAASNARAAHAQGDDHLIMLGGYVGTVPGVDEKLANRLPNTMLDGTSDTTNEGCRKLRSVAEGYASAYNRTIAKLAAGSPPGG